MNKQTEALKLALEALEETLRTLDDENAKPGGAISDTIWYSEHETLFDYIAAQITAIREALAEQPAQQHIEYCLWARNGHIPCPHVQPAQQEPVTWKDEQGNVRMALDAGEIQSSVGYVYSVHGERIKNACIRSDIPNGTPLYTSPPASKPWVGLTEKERNDLEDYCEMIIGKAAFEAIEAKLREKNA